MVAFKWNKHFITGITNVDNQHKKLVDIVNKLGNMVIENNLNNERTELILNQLVDYSTYHFAEERKIMAKYKIDKRHISKHITIHQQFIKEILYMASKKHEITEESSRELFDYLMHWLAYHILGIDQEMSRQIEIIKNGSTPEEAYEIVIEIQSNIAEPLLVALKGLFNQVSQKNAKLVNLNKNLEKKVLARTKELSDLNKNLEKISYTDQLTGINNRRYAIENLISLWDIAEKNDENLSCLMVDADNFKSVNDNYGHDAGDEVIKTLALTVKESLKPPLFVSRLGGDEFIIICPGLNLDGAIVLGELIKKNINKLKIHTGSGYWTGSVSIGVSSRSKDISDYEGLIKAADINVYEAKRAGKNCVKYLSI